jgi:long-subunit acyl-CoA synthetase (AMP-forming)
VVGFDEIEAAGRAADDAALDAEVAAQSPDDVSLLIYTSGSTGRP